jgi:hypothetical protein
MKTIYLIILLIAGNSISSYSQCCCVGTPSGGTTSIGILGQNVLRATLFARYSQSNDYYQGSSKVNQSGVYVQKANFKYVGAIVGYGITDDITLETEFGYFLNKTWQYSIATPDVVGSGLSSLVVSAKYNLFNSMEDMFEITAGVGAKLPFSTKPQIVDNVELNQDLQPSSGAYGAVLQAFIHKGFPDSDINLFLMNRTEINGSNTFPFPYRYGNSYITSLYASKKIIESLVGMLQLRYDIRNQDERDGKPFENSGGYSFIVSPQLSYHIDKLNFSVLCDIPVYKYYNNKQLANAYSAAFNISYLWNFNE